MKILSEITKSKTNFFVGIALIGLLVVLLFDFFDSKFSPHDILVEFHGLVFDLFVFGIILTTYETITSNKEKIERYKEEINDYRFWKSEEAMYRTRGLVKRLVDLKEKEIDLSNCFLETDKSLSSYKNMKSWEFSGAFLKDSLFLSNDLSDSKFYLTDLTNATFTKVNLSHCNFNHAILHNTSFDRCDFNDVELINATITDPNWFDTLKTKKNIGVEKMELKYFIGPAIIEGIDYYSICKK
jgi:hypothetical protein